jgi:hypothetical protein
MPDPELFVSLRDYIDAQNKAIVDVTNARLDGIDRAIKVALDANATAISKAEQATEYRLANLNEFRQSLSDQTKDYATKAEFEALRSGHDVEIKGLSKQIYIITGALAAVQVLLQFLPRA